ncbi:hypothetical protein OMP38_29605 [Cohnella ginsengisoli]|uniref:Uncharacterized protein n=1 Tax=Cohnella ginsengisoli TaxID=425004 RepID=A0A9X4KLY4_9BACL|nr:hypothetical protein [Cohnella ginsengisoli]MDG0794533.1 hypothetical protein [Cohnella ginsengisoli]
MKSKLLTSKSVPWILSLFVMVFTLWVLIVNNQRSFNGHMWGSLLPGATFGVPEVSKAIGMYPVTQVGWDGQFYYNISNDLLGNTDVPAHIDSPSYRYQRITVPLLANLLSKLLGYYSYTPPLVFHLVQILLMGLAIYILSSFLIKKGISPYYSLFWGLSINSINTLLHGLTDASADSLFIISLILILEKRYNLYVLAASLLLLNREGYAVFAAVVFILAFFGKLEVLQKFKLSSIKFAIPGILLIVWYAYVTIHFGQTPSSQAHGMTSWFGKGWLVNTAKSYSAGNNKEVFIHLVAICFLVFATFLSYMAARKNVIWYSVLAYIVLLWHLGMGATDIFGNYLKVLVVLGVLFVTLFNDFNRWYKIVLIALMSLIVVPSSIFMLKNNVVEATTWQYVGFKADPKIQDKPVENLTNFNSEIKVLGQIPSFVIPTWYAGKNDVELKVQVKNTGNEVWRGGSQLVKDK